MKRSKTGGGKRDSRGPSKQGRLTKPDRGISNGSRQNKANRDEKPFRKGSRQEGQSKELKGREDSHWRFDRSSPRVGGEKRKERDAGRFNHEKNQLSHPKQPERKTERGAPHSQRPMGRRNNSGKDEKPGRQNRFGEEREGRPFFEKRDERPSFSGSGKPKRRRSHDKKPIEQRDDSPPRGKLKSKHSNHQNDSPRSYAENRYQKKGNDFRSKGRQGKEGVSKGRPWNRKENHRFYGDRSKSQTQFPKTPDDGSVRLNKFIANAGICSRREADELIAAGVVSVNGKIITEMGYKVMPGDSVKYNNELLRSERLVYILLNKPKDFITTTDDPEDRKTVMNLIAKACKERVYPVGRLDRNTTGVLLFTNDGDLAKKLTHPSFEVHKVYQVELDRAVKNADLETILAGMKLDDGFIKPDDAVYTNIDKNVIGMELHSGKNRIVRRIFEHLGYEVKKLDRVVFAGLTKKDLPRGRWRFLSEMEVAGLKMLTGKVKGQRV